MSRIFKIPQKVLKRTFKLKGYTTKNQNQVKIVWDMVQNLVEAKQMRDDLEREKQFQESNASK